jgi:hypothetical protein
MSDANRNDQATTNEPAANAPVDPAVELSDEQLKGVAGGAGRPTGVVVTSSGTADVGGGGVIINN